MAFKCETKVSHILSHEFARGEANTKRDPQNLLKTTAAGYSMEFLGNYLTSHNIIILYSPSFSHSGRILRMRRKKFATYWLSLIVGFFPGRARQVLGELGFRELVPRWNKSSTVLCNEPCCQYDSILSEAHVKMQLSCFIGGATGISLNRQPERLWIQHVASKFFLECFSSRVASWSFYLETPSLRHRNTAPRGEGLLMTIFSTFFFKNDR